MLWSSAETQRLRELHETAEGGYLKLKPKPFRTRGIAEYKAITADAESWAALDHQMDHYFDDEIDFFPYSDSILEIDRKHEGEEAPVPRKVSFLLKLNEFLAGIAKPDRFFEIQAAIIERRFPGGRTNDIGDADLRDLVSSLRLIFSKNFLRLILGRRALQCFGSAVVISILALAGAGITSLLVVTIFCPSIILLIALWYSLLKERYEGAMTESCSNLRTGAQVRQQELYALIPLVFAQIDRDKFELKRQNRLDKWPEETSKWSKLIFWVEGRVEHNELFMQLEMWRLRRVNWHLRNIALALSLAIAMAGVAFGLMSHDIAESIFGAKQSDQEDAIHWWLVNALQLLAVAVLGVMSTSWQLPHFDLIERTLKTKDMKGLQDVKLYAQIAEFMFIEKSSQLHEEEKIAGKKI